MSEQKFPVIKLNISGKRSYFTAFVYLPTGIEVCKSKSIRAILTQYHLSPTSHAAICKVENRQTKFKFFLVVGKYSSINRNKNKYFYKIVKTSPVIIQPGESKRAKYYLIKETWKDNVGFNKEIEIAFAWRSFPKKHLDQLKFIDDPKLLKKEKGDRWSNLEFR